MWCCSGTERLLLEREAPISPVARLQGNVSLERGACDDSEASDTERDIPEGEEDEEEGEEDEEEGEEDEEEGEKEENIQGQRKEQPEGQQVDPCGLSTAPSE
ncbi:bromo and FHA domain-containing protein DDB_G0267958 [Etheostoma spectabile]|uniref:bromo and FHA domain-containing protein DDB_G0267958 n=1 Tax=Etheostoma spectabile TaxID=54343 RepID=UPI0013AFEC7C|nr:bromo and FHA domain-containing protein DDB_G0267958-like [Etheostoma spectabile]